MAMTCIYNWIRGPPCYWDVSLPFLLPIEKLDEEFLVDTPDLCI